MKQEKNTFTKAEIAQTLGVQPYIMALWEKQFGIKTTLIQGEYFYLEQDLVKFTSIRALLYEKGYTIDAAKQYLQENPDVLETTMIAASPLIFTSHKEQTEKKRSDVFIQQLISLQQRLIRLREFL